MGSPFPSSSRYPACLAGPLPAFPHATVGILHFISSHTHSGCGPQSASFGGKRDFALSCAGSSVNCVCSYRPTWAQVQETWEIKQNHSSRFQFCLPYHHHRGVSGKGSQCFPKTPASVCRYLWGQDNSSREHTSAQTNAKMSLPFAFRAAITISLCFIFQLS